MNTIPGSREVGPAPPVADGARVCVAGGATFVVAPLVADPFAVGPFDGVDSSSGTIRGVGVCSGRIGTVVGKGRASAGAVVAPPGTRISSRARGSSTVGAPPPIRSRAVEPVGVVEVG